VSPSTFDATPRSGYYVGRAADAAGPDVVTELSGPDQARPPGAGGLPGRTDIEVVDYAE
jgi:hypothetical protein